MIVPLLAARIGAAEPFVVQVVDGATMRGVPLVELKATNQRTFYTDNAGVVAIDDPILMGRDVFFFVGSHGYEFPKDGFGNRGKAVRVEAGKGAKFVLTRKNLAERLYRITGSGLYEHALAAGHEAPIKAPLLSAQVVGCDGAQAAIYGGKLFWTWGDTSRLRYPLGNFHGSAATSLLPENGGLDPSVGIDLDHFENAEGFAREIAPIPGEGPTWLTALSSVNDRAGKERLVATYQKIKPPLSVYEVGLCEFDDKEQKFKKLLSFDKSQKVFPSGHALRQQAGDKKWLYFGEATPHMRVADLYENLIDPKNYEAVKADASFVDAQSGKMIKAHHGAVSFSQFRKRWVSIFTEEFGDPSYLGEIWYAEAPSPEGPWRKAIKVVTHDRYSFYNPKQHPYFSDSEGRYLYFEGTYSEMFSGNTNPTPLYDYNQIMYRLDLTDERLKPAQEALR